MGKHGSSAKKNRTTMGFSNHPSGYIAEGSEITISKNICRTHPAMFPAVLLTLVKTGKESWFLLMSVQIDKENVVWKITVED